MEKIPDKPTANPKEVEPTILDPAKISYRQYEKTDCINKVIKMIETELSEPYSIFLYRYFFQNFPQLTIFAVYEGETIGVIIGKIEKHGERQRGYIGKSFFGNRSSSK
jgi:peptide alpha-N-acetyltransferase